MTPSECLFFVHLYFACKSYLNTKTKNELDKALDLNMTWLPDFKDLPRTAASDKVLRNKAFNIAANLKYDGYQRDLASMVHKFFDKKSARANTSGGTIKIGFLSIQPPSDSDKELHKPVIEKFEKRKVYSSFRITFGMVSYQICN